MRVEWVVARFVFRNLAHVRTRSKRAPYHIGTERFANVIETNKFAMHSLKVARQTDKARIIETERFAIWLGKRQDRFPATTYVITEFCCCFC